MENNEVNNHEAQTDVSAIVAEAGNDPALQDKQAGAVEGSGQVATQATDYHAEATDLVEFAYDSLTPLYPSLVGVYTPDVREKLSARSAKLMEKYGLTVGDFMGKWGDEIMFLMLVVPLASKTVVAIKTDNARAEQQVEEKPAATVMQPIVEATAPDSLHTKI